MAPRALLMGVDLGTSSTKAVIVDQNGQLKSLATQEYNFDTPQPGWAEQDPDVWLDAALQTMRQALSEADIAAGEIEAIGLSGQMHGTVCLSGDGQPVRPAIIWADQRSWKQVQRVEREIGKRRMAEWTANPLATGFMLATWLWLQENEPETARSTARLLLPKDYVRYRLTGELGSEPSDASSTLLFDIVQQRWSKTLLDALGIDTSLLPPVFGSAEIAGGLNAAMAASCGLRSGTPVVLGGSDQSMQALGNGIVEPGILSCTIGTGGQLLAPTRDPVFDPDLRLHLFCHAMPNTWYLMGAILSAGLSLKWLRDSVFGDEPYQAMAQAASDVPPGAEGLFFLPYLAGERTPHMDPDAQGAFVGLTLRHHRGHLVRAVMEGVVLALRDGFELMLELGVPVERVVASGGGTRHPLWLQLQADVLNRPIHQTQTEEAAAVGAALLAGVGINVYSDVREACRRSVRWRTAVVQPNPEDVAHYDEAFLTYKRLYPALKAVQGGTDEKQ
jgi:xylulokinase